VTLVTFADAASHDGWRTHPEHREAQKAGRAGYYREYSVAVGTVERATAWARPEEA
jgi:heme-degrading monooxygenase HmoA